MKNRNNHKTIKNVDVEEGMIQSEALKKLRMQLVLK